MRTTLDLDDYVLAVARDLAKQTHVSLGAAVSELARRGLAPRQAMPDDTGLPAFEVAAGSPPLTPDLVREALEEL